MPRLTILALTLAVLTPLSPFGCPPSEVPEELLPFDRGTLAVEAAATPPAVQFGETMRLQAAARAATGTVSYQWFQTAGTGTPINGAAQATAQCQAPSVASDQTLQFMVTARDEAGAVGRARVDVAVAADPDFGRRNTGTTRLRANAGADQTVLPGVEVRLDGSGSTGTSLTYRWRQVSGATVTLSSTTSAVAKFTAPTYSASNNVLVFELSVTDGEGRLGTDQVQITVKNPNAAAPRVTVSTSLGDFVVELNEDKAPITVRNFLRYVDDRFYDGTLFHRVIENFMIQGGGYTPDLVEKDTRNQIVNEASNGLSNVRGTIAMARTGDPNSATSQFFVNLKDNIKDGDGLSNLDPNGVDPYGYAVFGKVVSGMDVVDEIGAVDTRSRNGFDDVPVEDVIIRSIRRVQQGSETGDLGGKFPSSETFP